MVNFESMVIGDKVYIVKETNNAFNKAKLTMVDADGIEWYRYDRDNWEYEIVVVEYCGMSWFSKKGTIRFDEDHLNSYHFKYPDGQIWPEEDDSYLHNWFLTKDEADRYIEKLKFDRK